MTQYEHDAQASASIVLSRRENFTTRNEFKLRLLPCSRLPLAAGCMFSFVEVEQQMPKRVLDVGQCDPDHGTIRRYLTREFSDVEIVRTSLPADTLAALRARP